MNNAEFSQGTMQPQKTHMCFTSSRGIHCFMHLAMHMGRHMDSHDFLLLHGGAPTQAITHRDHTHSNACA